MKPRPALYFWRGKAQTDPRNCSHSLRSRTSDGGHFCAVNRAPCRHHTSLALSLFFRTSLVGLVAAPAATATKYSSTSDTLPSEEAQGSKIMIDEVRKRSDRTFLLAFVCVLVISVTPARAWWCSGHMITTQIALQLLPAAVRNYFTDISDFQQMYYPDLTSLTEVSCWADDIKSFTKEYSTWHYYDQCLMFAPLPNVACPVNPDGELPTALTLARAKLASAVNASLSIAEQGFWLSILVHLVGDFHQPLHVTTLYSARFPTGDVGGNAFTIYVNNKKTNLHSFHDSCGGLLAANFPQRPLAEYVGDLTDIETLSTSLIMSQTFAYPNQPFVTNESVWLEEIFEIGKNVSYSLPNGTQLPFGANLTTSSPYVLRLQSVLQNQLALGGRRLAAIMMEIYDAVMN